MEAQPPNIPAHANPKPPESAPPPVSKFHPGQAAAGFCAVVVLAVFIVVFANSRVADLGIALFGLLPFISLLLVGRRRTRSFGLGLLLTSGLVLLAYVTICGGVAVHPRK